MRQRNREVSKRCRIWKWLLLLPLMDLGPTDILGEAGDHQADELEQAFRVLQQPIEIEVPELRVTSAPEDPIGPTAEVRPEAEPEPEKGIKGRLVEWLKGFV
jgi:hypothetical protein